MTNIPRHPAEAGGSIQKEERPTERLPSYEEISDHHERHTHTQKYEHHNNNREHEQDTALSEAHNAASTIEEVRSPRQEISPAERRGPVTKKQLDREFIHTMNSIQQEMTPRHRAFSKFIHIRSVEAASEFLSGTIARPNALLAGSIGAFTITLAIYLFAKSIGYALSGFEPIAAFIIGWLIGLLYDYLRVMITGKR